MQRETTPTNFREKRSSTRIAHECPIPSIDMGETGRYPEELSGSVTLLDLSDGGIKLRVEGMLPMEGSIVQVRIPLPERSVTLPVIAQIKWANKVRYRRYHVGLQFLV